MTDPSSVVLPATQIPAVPPTPPDQAHRLSRLHAAAAVRIAFGVIWAIDATFKWLPGFVHGQTLDDELGGAATISTPVVHQWIGLWHSVGTAQPAAFAVGIAVVESLIALGMLLGALSNLTFIGSAILSFGIWSAAEGFHLPWSRPGITDLGPSVGYIVASLALFLCSAGATWSLDSALRLRRRLGPLGFLAGASAGASSAPAGASSAPAGAPGSAPTGAHGLVPPVGS